MKKFFAWLAIFLACAFAQEALALTLCDGSNAACAGRNTTTTAGVRSSQSVASASSVYGDSWIPVGTVITWPYAGPPEDAEKWLECDGRKIIKSKYPTLYAMFVKTGATEAYTPNLEGQFLRGMDWEKKADGTLKHPVRSTGLDSLKSYTDARTQRHAHSFEGQMTDRTVTGTSLGQSFTSEKATWGMSGTADRQDFISDETSWSATGSVDRLSFSASSKFDVSGTAKGQSLSPATSSTSFSPNVTYNIQTKNEYNALDNAFVNAYNSGTSVSWKCGERTVCKKCSYSGSTYHDSLSCADSSKPDFKCLGSGPEAIWCSDYHAHSRNFPTTVAYTYNPTQIITNIPRGSDTMGGTISASTTLSGHMQSSKASGTTQEGTVSGTTQKSAASGKTIAGTVSGKTDGGTVAGTSSGTVRGTMNDSMFQGALAKRSGTGNTAGSGILEATHTGSRANGPDETAPRHVHVRYFIRAKN